MNRAALPVCLLLLALSPAVSAQQDGSTGNNPNDQPSPHRGPPPEAYAACDGKIAGASASITLRDGRTVEGVCELVGDRLAARPLHRPGGGPGNGGQPGSGSSSGS